MTLTVLTSASGSPGVSTSALGMSLAWSKPVLLVEADPTGGSAILAGWFHGRPPHDLRDHRCNAFGASRRQEYA